MSDVKKIFAEKKFPSFITGHNLFKNFKEVKKVFPEIGLPNSEKEIEVDNTKEAQDAAKALLAGIQNALNERLRTINKYADKKSDMGAKRKVKLENSKELLTEVKNQLSKSAKNFVISNNGRITLNLPNDIISKDKKVVFKSGEGLFRVYNKLNETLREGHFLAMDKLENFHEFKEFSTKNVPSLKYKIRFSSDGAEGLWDIATMSMRGISSCQTWGTGNSSHIVGSMVDPFTAIIYLTSGGKFNEHGSKMIRRCIVRFVVDEKKKIPFIAIERMYPSMEKPALDKFVDFLKERTDNKFEIVYLPDSRRYGMYVPMSKIVGALPAHEQPYRDSGLAYKVDVNDIKGKIREEIQTKLDSIYTAFASKTVTAMRSMKIGTVPEKSKKAFKSLRGTDYSWDCSYAVYEDLMAEIKKFFMAADVNKYTDSSSFLKENIESFKKDNDKRIFSILKKSASTRVNKSLGSIDDEVLQTAAKLAEEKINTYFDSELKKLKPSKKTVSNKPDPAELAIPIYTKLLN
jgi:hypothetical protein